MRPSFKDITNELCYTLVNNYNELSLYILFNNYG